MAGVWGSPEPTVSLSPQPAPGGCTPLTCARPAEPSQLLAAPAVPPDTCGAGDTGAGRSGYSLRSRPRPVQCGAVPVASPRPCGRGCDAGHAQACAVLPGARAGVAVGQGHPVPCRHRSIASPGSLCPCCRLCPSPPVCASAVGPWPEAGAGPSRFQQELTAPHRGSVPGGLSPLGGTSPDLRGQEWLCIGRGARGTGHTVHGMRGSTSRRSAWLSTCRRLFLART